MTDKEKIKFIYLDMFEADQLLIKITFLSNWDLRFKFTDWYKASKYYRLKLIAIKKD